MIGLSRQQAADWVSLTTGYSVSRPSIEYWERSGLLRRQTPGQRVPAKYRIDDLVRLRLIAELRREGAPLQRIRRAVRKLTAIFPEMSDRPGAWTLAVLSNGDVVRAAGLTVTDLTGRPGQTGWVFILDAREYVRAAEMAMEVRTGTSA